MINELLEQLKSCIEDTSDMQRLPVYASQITSLDDDETARLFRELTELASNSDDTKWTSAYSTLLGNIPLDPKNRWPGPAFVDQIVSLYELTPATSPFRCQLLAILANIDSSTAIQSWADLLCTNPPATSEGINYSFQPLLTDDVVFDQAMLRRLIDEATGNIHVAAAVYDLTNHAVRSGKVETHPADHRREQICELLGALIQKLSQIEEGHLPDGESPTTIAETISNAVALIVALTDCVALLREEKAAGKLRAAAELKHRRIQIEAAAALALMGDEWGKNKLIECAAEPSIRQRAIAYAKELGIEKQVSLEYTGPIATAESYLAMWLSMPEQMGLAPTEMKLIDQRKLYWPGYEDQRDCFLFEYRYGLGDNAHVNIGISGPATHAFSSDLTQLSVEDQYAAFAGWQTLSDEIYLIPIERAQEMLAAKTAQLIKLMEEKSNESTTLQAVASFFGSHALIASTIQDGVPGTWIVDEESAHFMPEHNSSAPIDWRTALDIWKGRRLLASFNPAFSN